MLFLEDKEEQKPINSVQGIDSGVIESLLLGVREAFHSTFADSLKQTLADKLSTYIDFQLSDIAITFKNKNDLLLYLSEKFEAVQILVAVCKEAKNNFPNRSLSLSLNKEIDKSGFLSISLLIDCSEYLESEDNTIRDFGLKFFDIFGKHNILFYSMADYPI